MDENQINSAIATIFPNIRRGDFRKTSDCDGSYNCIGWAVDSFNTSQWWWPNGRDGTGQRPAFWPKGCPKGVTTDDFIATFESLGYEVCANGKYESDFSKIALFAKVTVCGYEPTHAAVLVGRGRWSSKLGKFVDIEHINLDGLCGITYGIVFCYMKRRRESS